MEKHQEGLNYVPMLTQSLTPTNSGRSRHSLHRSQSERSIIYYNGNYEGDSSMFRKRGYELERLSLVDSESDTEDLSKEISFITAVQANKNNSELNSFFCRLMKFLLVNFLKPKMSEKALQRFELFRQSALCHKLTKCAKILMLVVGYGFHFALLLGKNLAAVGRFFWKQRVIFHNLVRRLLWRLTLAKCSDRLLFFYVLLSLPFLFGLSLIGFIISICGGLKDAFYYGVHILNKIKLN